MKIILPRPTLIMLDVLLAVLIVLVGLILATWFTGDLRGQAESLPAMEMKLWQIPDSEDPLLVAAGVEAPAFALELCFHVETWPVKDHQITGLSRQIARLVQREWKLGLPVVIRAFVSTAAGETFYAFEGGALGLVLARDGMSFYF